MTIVFVSNYLNHHQIPFCEAVVYENQGDFTFIQTQRMEAERQNMGWGIDISDYSFAKEYYEEPLVCQRLIDEADIVIFGGVEDEQYILARLKAGKPVIRYSERLYKEGQWKFITPRGLKKKYIDHTQYRNKPVYLLCAGGYVASDFSLVRAYPNKMYSWGYFPKFIEYDINEMMNAKNASWTNFETGSAKPIEIMWAGRMIDWKHPEMAVRAASYLRKNKVDFHMTIVGDGDMKNIVINEATLAGLSDVVTFENFTSPDEIRSKMLSSDIYLFTSDYMEGWGVVLNEAMNAGCAVIASSGIGAVPFLLKHGKNGMVFKSGNQKELNQYALELCKDTGLRQRLGLAAYEVIRTKWNPESAASRFVRFARGIMYENPESVCDNGPLSKAPIISPSKGYKYVRND